MTDLEEWLLSGHVKQVLRTDFQDIGVTVCTAKLSNNFSMLQTIVFVDGVACGTHISTNLQATHKKMIERVEKAKLIPFRKLPLYTGNATDFEKLLALFRLQKGI